MTAITLILVVDALIAGIYGMDVAFPAFADRVSRHNWKASTQPFSQSGAESNTSKPSDR
jgi:hypothetical protein